MKEFTQPSGKFSLADNLRDLCERFELLSIHQGQQDRQIAALQNELKIHGAVHNYAEKDTIERLCNRAKNLENRFANLEAPFTGIATDIDEICKKVDALALRLFNIEAEVRDMKAEDITKIADGDAPKSAHVPEWERLASQWPPAFRPCPFFIHVKEPAEPEAFDFITAVQHMREGRRVRRPGWPDSISFGMRDGEVEWSGFVQPITPKDRAATDWTLAKGGDVPKRDTEGLGFHIAELRRDVDALLAYRKIDYETVTEVLRRFESFEKLTKPAAPETERPTEPETFDFVTAVKYMEAGKRVRRASWPKEFVNWEKHPMRGNFNCIVLSKSKRSISSDEHHEAMVSTTSALATDWMLADDV